MIEGHKIMRDTERIDCRILLPISEVHKTSGHRHRIRGKRFRSDLKQFFFTQRVVSA